MWMYDKCGEAVEPSNDAVDFEFLIQHGHRPNAFGKFNYGARHLLPTGDCEGSPSRAQYIKGQPRDTRGYDYMPDHEQAARKAYQMLQS